MKEIDTRLGVKDASRTVEYIFTKPAWKLFFSGSFLASHSSVNPYGHAVIRYVEPVTGKDIIMNVSGMRRTPLINFFETEEYLFTDKSEVGNEQGGVFNRSFLSVRIEDVDPDDISRLHQFYCKLWEMNLKGQVQYGLMLYVLTNPIRQLLGKSKKGNCSYWTGLGLKEIDLIHRTSSWPLLLWFRLLFSQMKDDANHQKINIIAYPSINYKNEPKGSLMAPKIGLSYGYSDYWDLNSFANIKVITKKNEDDSYSSTIKEQPHVRQIWTDTKEKMKSYVRFKQ